MNLRPIATFGISGGLGTLTALSPLCQLDPKAALIAGIVSGLFMLVCEHIREDANSHIEPKSQPLFREFSLILCITLATIVAYGVLKGAKYDIQMGQALGIAFAAGVGNLALNGIEHLFPRQK